MKKTYSYEKKNLRAFNRLELAGSYQFKNTEKVESCHKLSFFIRFINT